MRTKRGATVDWYQKVFELIDMRSFSNLWYWIALAVLWSSASHWVLGVPFDMVTRARRKGGQAVEDLDLMVTINVNRLLYISETAGVGLIGTSAFMLSTLAVLAFYYNVEFAQALIFLLAPMTLVFQLSLRTARRIRAEGVAGPALWRRLMQHRMVVQGIGVVSIFVTSLYGMWQNLHIGVFG